MSSKTSKFDHTFIERQRERLIQLRTELSRTARAVAVEEAEIKSHSLGQARESEDDAQKLALLEIDGSLVSRDMARLLPVERALKKIEEGTYGFSDVSGEAIPQERLEAMPEAICTVVEEEARDSTR